jgi:hypothetical protein
MRQCPNNEFTGVRGSSRALVLAACIYAGFASSATAQLTMSFSIQLYSSEWSTSRVIGRTIFQRNNLPLASEVVPPQLVPGGSGNASVEVRQDGSIEVRANVSCWAASPSGCDVANAMNSYVTVQGNINLSLSAFPDNPTPTPPYSVEFVTSSTTDVDPLDTPIATNASPNSVTGLMFPYGNILVQNARFANNSLPAIRQAFVTDSLSNNSGRLQFDIDAKSGLFRTRPDDGCSQVFFAAAYGGTAGGSFILHGLRATDAAGFPLRVSNSFDGVSLPDLHSTSPICPLIDVQPQGGTVCASIPTSLALVVQGAGPFTYQWRKDGATIDPIANPSAATDTLTLGNVSPDDIAAYDCIVSNACGSVTSNPATLTICIGDFNCDGGIDGSDIEMFFAEWSVGDVSADVNYDGGIDGADVEVFFERWVSGC